MVSIGFISELKTNAMLTPLILAEIGALFRASKKLIPDNPDTELPTLAIRRRKSLISLSIFVRLNTFVRPIFGLQYLIGMAISEN